MGRRALVGRRGRPRTPRGRRPAPGGARPGSRDRHQIGGVARRDLPEGIAEAEQLGGAGRRGADRLERRHAVLDHQSELGQERAVEVERRAGVGARGDRHAGRQRRLEAPDVRVDHGLGLPHGVVRDPRGDAAGDVAAGAFSVGTRNVPRSRIRATISSVR